MEGRVPYDFHLIKDAYDVVVNASFIIITRYDRLLISFSEQGRHFGQP
jgi:hypothetical protein